MSKKVRRTLGLGLTLERGQTPGHSAEADSKARKESISPIKINQMTSNIKFPCQKPSRNTINHHENLVITLCISSLHVLPS